MPSTKEYHREYGMEVRRLGRVAKREEATKQIAKQGYSSMLVNKRIRERRKQKSATKWQGVK